MSSVVLNVTFDCADPVAQAAFWSQVVGQPVEDATDPDNTYWVVGSPDGPGPRLVFVPVPEPRGGKNRIHVDLVPRDRSQAAEVDRLVGCGASVVDDRRRPGTGGWVVMADPEGNLFCVEPPAQDRPEA